MDYSMATLLREVLTLELTARGKRVCLDDVSGLHKFKF
jgi:hypothetical protein